MIRKVPPLNRLYRRFALVNMLLKKATSSLVGAVAFFVFKTI